MFINMFMNATFSNTFDRKTIIIRSFRRIVCFLIRGFIRACLKSGGTTPPCIGRFVIVVMGKMSLSIQRFSRSVGMGQDHTIC